MTKQKTIDDTRYCTEGHVYTLEKLFKKKLVTSSNVIPGEKVMLNNSSGLHSGWRLSSKSEAVKALALAKKRKITVYGI